MIIPNILSHNWRWITNKAKITIQYVCSRIKSESFDLPNNPKLFCLFIGYPRSGHSLVGSLLDAHPNSIIANELDVLRFVSAGFNRKQIHYLLFRNSQQHSQKGRTQTGYKYDVPNQWQGRVEKLLVLGDKKGGMTTQRLSKNPLLLHQIQSIIDLPIKFVHVVRNPFDNITTMKFRTDSTINREIFHYFELCLKNAIIQNMAGDADFLTIRHEDLIVNPEATVSQITTFLGLETRPDYLKDCASIIYPSPHKSRIKHHWSAKEIALVNNQLSRFLFLSGYTFDN